MNICFRYGEITIDDNSWRLPTHLPRLGESLCLGNEGVYFWYTIKVVCWTSGSSVVFLLTDKRVKVEV